MARRGMAGVVALVLLAGCGTATTAGTSGGPGGHTYAGPMKLPIDYDDYATVAERSGAAGRALECDTAPYDGGGADYDSGLASAQTTARKALANYFAEEGWYVPHGGYRVEREDDGRTLFSLDVKGETKFAFIAADDIRDFNHERGWGIEAWAQCDPAELPEAVTQELGIQVWEDESGRRVPVARVRSHQGPEHCDWQSIVFLSLGDERRGAQYLRETTGELKDFLRTTFDAHATLPANAVDTGYYRNGRHLWVHPDRRAAYLVSVDDPQDVERWPGTKPRVSCA